MCSRPFCNYFWLIAGNWFMIKLLYIFILFVEAPFSLWLYNERVSGFCLSDCISFSHSRKGMSSFTPWPHLKQCEPCSLYTFVFSVTWRKIFFFEFSVPVKWCEEKTFFITIFSLLLQLTVLNKGIIDDHGTLRSRVHNFHFKVKENSVDYFYPGSRN